MDLYKKLIDTSALKKGHFVLSSGLHSDTYVQCQKLFEDTHLGDALALRLANRTIGCPTLVLSAAFGGLCIGLMTAKWFDCRFVFAERVEGQLVIRRDQEIKATDRIMLIDDVCSTGKTFEELKTLIKPEQIFAYGAIINRFTKDCPYDPFYSLVQIKANTWTEEECPLCKEGTPLIKPGSRAT